MKTEIELQIELVNPLIGVAFCLQRGKDELVDCTVSVGENIVFLVPMSVREGNDGSPNFLGEFAQGTPRQRFIYICSGMRAGQLQSCWDRRAKIQLSSIDWPLIRKSCSNSGNKLRVKFQATGKDGGPSCATVPFLGNGWEAIEVNETK